MMRALCHGSAVRRCPNDNGNDNKGGKPNKALATATAHSPNFENYAWEVERDTMLTSLSLRRVEGGRCKRWDPRRWATARGCPQTTPRPPPLLAPKASRPTHALLQLWRVV